VTTIERPGHPLGVPTGDVDIGGGLVIMDPADMRAMQAAVAMLEREERDRQYADDPVAWVRDVLGEHAWSMQAAIMRAVATEPLVAVQSCHGSGKSHLASRVILWFLATRPLGETFVVTTAPSSAQVRAILWRYIRQGHEKAGMPGKVHQTAEYKIDGELIAYGRKPADYSQSAFQGIHARHLLIVLDEAGGIPKALWDAADSLATGRDSHLLAIGNPDDNSSHFAQVCQTEPGWRVFKISAYDTPNLTGEIEDVPEHLREEMRDVLVTKAWVDDKVRRWGTHNPLFIAKVLGEFADSEDGLIPLSWVRAAHHRWHAWNDANEERARRGLGPVEPPGRRIISVDVARYGTDQTAIATRQGQVVMKLEKWPKLDTTQTTGLVQARLRSHPQAHSVVDVNGVGAGVVDQLRRAKQSVSAFNSSKGTKRRDSTGEWKFPNMRSAAWYNLRELLDPALDAQLALPEDDDLTADLVTPKYEPRAGGILVVEDKDEIKKRLGRSPDSGDAVAMGCWSDTPERESEFDEPAAHQYAAGRPPPVVEPGVAVTSLNDGPPPRPRRPVVVPDDVDMDDPDGWI
jgi:hypothetical protein